jgi:hypothetical protein
MPSGDCACELLFGDLAGTTLGIKIRTMCYWWVNQNQTFRHEFEGGYLWSPKRNANGARNPFYETMRESLARRSDLVVRRHTHRRYRHRRFLLL